MRTRSILKTHFIVELAMLILITVPNFTFIWICLTLVWQRVTFLWIINEDMVNIENTCHSWVRHDDISHCIKFHLYLTMLDTCLTIYHFCHFSMNNWWGYGQYWKWMSLFNCFSWKWTRYQILSTCYLYMPCFGTLYSCFS